MSRDGAYRIFPVAPGEWKVHARISHSGRSTFGKVVLAEGQAEAVLDLLLEEVAERGLVLTGQVLLNGEPRAGLTVSARRVVSTDHEGRFRIDGLAPGVRTLRVTSPFSRLLHEQEITLSGDDDVTIELAAVPVRGRVVDAAGGEPLAASVSLERVEGYHFTVDRMGDDVQADFRGLFTFGEVTPGAYRVTARMDGYSSASHDFEVVGGGRLDDLELRLAATPLP